MCGELSDAPLDQLAALSTQVFMPLLGGGASGGGGSSPLPEVVAQGLAEGMTKFAAMGERWRGVVGGWAGGRLLRCEARVPLPLF